MAFMIKNDQNAKSGNTGRPIGTAGTIGNTGRSVGNGGAFGRGQKKEWPFCTYCNIPGHIVEMCYKLHGYPPGFKSKQQPKSQQFNNSNVAVNQVSGSSTQPSSSVDETSNTASSLLQNLTGGQCQKLFSLLSTHLTIVNHSTDNTTSPSSYSTGTCCSVSIKQIFYLLNSGS